MIRLLPASILLALAATSGAEPSLPFQSAGSPFRAGRLEFRETHRFAGAIAPAGEGNLFRHALGMDQFGNTFLSAAYGLSPAWRLGLSWEKERETFGAEVVYSPWRQGPDRPPVSLALAATWRASSMVSVIGFSR